MTALVMILTAIAVAVWALRLQAEWEHRRNVKRTLRLINNWYSS